MSDIEEMAKRVYATVTNYPDESVFLQVERVMTELEGRGSRRQCAEMIRLLRAQLHHIELPRTSLSGKRRCPACRGPNWKPGTLTVVDRSGATALKTSMICVDRFHRRSSAVTPQPQEQPK